MMAFYTNHLKDEVKIIELTITYYICSENISMNFYDTEAIELWEYLCNFICETSGAMNE
jgi:hypothetical protein